MFNFKWIAIHLSYILFFFLVCFWFLFGIIVFCPSDDMYCEEAYNDWRTKASTIYHSPSCIFCTKSMHIPFEKLIYYYCYVQILCVICYKIKFHSPAFWQWVSRIDEPFFSAHDIYEWKQLYGILHHPFYRGKKVLSSIVICWFRASFILCSKRCCMEHVESLIFLVSRLGISYMLCSLIPMLLISV